MTTSPQTACPSRANSSPRAAHAQPVGSGCTWCSGTWRRADSTTGTASDVGSVPARWSQALTVVGPKKAPLCVQNAAPGWVREVGQELGSFHSKGSSQRRQKLKMQRIMTQA